MVARKMLTLHAPLTHLLADPVLRLVEQRLRLNGIKEIWLSLDDLPDVVVKARIAVGHPLSEPGAIELLVGPCGDLACTCPDVCESSACTCPE